MANTITKTVQATSATTSAYKLSPAEQKAIDTAKAEFVRTDALLEEILTLKQKFQNVGADFAAGKLDLMAAAGIIACDVDRPELIGKLRAPVKQLQREVLASVGEVLGNARQHGLDELAAKCKKLETVERQSSAELGIGDDDFTPSSLLESLREQHRRHAATVGTHFTKSNLAAL